MKPMIQARAHGSGLEERERQATSVGPIVESSPMPR